MKDITESRYNRMDDVIDIIRILRKEEQFKDVDLNEGIINRLELSFTLEIITSLKKRVCC